MINFFLKVKFPYYVKDLFDQRTKKYIFFKFLSLYLYLLDILRSFEENHCKIFFQLHNSVGKPSFFSLVGTLIHLYVSQGLSSNFASKIKKIQAYRLTSIPPEMSHYPTIFKHYPKILHVQGMFQKLRAALNRNLLSTFLKKASSHTFDKIDWGSI